MRLFRGLRSINLMCMGSCFIGLCATVLVLLVVLVVQTILAYDHFVLTYPFSTVPFWQDNRTVTETPPLPVLTTNAVNLSSSTIVITACCRNVEKHLVQFQRNIRAITALFGRYRIYLGESDSHDGTLEILKNWEKSDPNHVHVQTKGFQRLFTSSREFFRTAVITERGRVAAEREYDLNEYRSLRVTMNHRQVLL
jgi:hypothetical protein